MEPRLFWDEYGANNAGTQQTSKTVYEGLDASGTKLNATTYTYNLQGRMSQVDVDSNGDGTSDSTSQYEYADDGTRVSETVNGTKTLLVVDGQNPTGYSQVLEEKNASGTVLKTFTLGLDVIAQQAPATQSGGTLYLLKDGHGSTRGLVDALGLPLSGQIYRYDAFGDAIGFNPANALTSRLYNSEPFRASIGLYDFRDRLYDPLLGRFPTLDRFFGRLSDPVTFHKYLFARADGVNFNDPLGLLPGGRLARYIAEVGVYVAYNALLGIRATYTIGEAYIDENLRPEKDVFINQQIARESDDDYDSNWWSALWTHRPDIYDVGNNTVYEVKHDTPPNIAKARNDLDTDYVPQLTARWGAPFTKGPWHPGGTLPGGNPMFPSGKWYEVDWGYGFTIPKIRIQARRVEPGIIVWRSDPVDDVVLMVVIAIEARAAIATAIGAGATGSELVNATNRARGRPATAPPAGAWYATAASIGIMTLGGIGLAGG